MQFPAIHMRKFLAAISYTTRADERLMSKTVHKECDATAMPTNAMWISYKHNLQTRCYNMHVKTLYFYCSEK